MADLKNLKDYDAKIAECVGLLEKLNQKHFHDQSKKGHEAWSLRQAEQIEMLAQSVVELYRAVKALADGNRDGRG